MTFSNGKDFQEEFIFFIPVAMSLVATCRASPTHCFDLLEKCVEPFYL